MTDEEAGRVRDFVGYGRNPPDPEMAGRGACRGQFRHQLRGRRRVVRAGRRSRLRDRPDRRLDRLREGPRPRRREHVRVRQPRRLLAPASHVHQAQAALHGVRHRPRARAQPEACAAMREAGWDVAGHGYKWEIHGNMAPDYEKKQIELATESITRTIGTRPLGWYSRYAPSMHTRNMLLDAGYEYDSDTYDDELPYWLKVGATAADRSLFGGPQRRALRAPGHDVGRRVPRLHQERRAMRARRGSAAHAELRPAQPHHRPSRPRAGLARVLDWLADQPRVWITRRIDIARHWKQVHPAP